MSSSSRQIQISEIAVIVAAKNEETNIKLCIDSILIACEGKAQVIVIDDGSTDQTPSILKNYNNSIQVITTQGVGPSIARNQGMAATDRPYVAFADADCMVHPLWLQKLSAGLMDQSSDGSYVSVGGSQEMHPRAENWDLFHAAFLEAIGFVSDYVHENHKTKTVKHNPTCNVLYVKDEILKMGGFDPLLWPCEDLDLDIRLAKTGKKFLFTPEAIVYHHRPNSFKGFMKMMRRYGFGHAQLVKKHGLSQKIHAMPILIPVMLGLYFWTATREKMMDFSLFLLMILIFIIFVRVKSFIRTLIYGVYLIPTVISWNIGFFSGLLQPMRITQK